MSQTSLQNETIAFTFFALKYSEKIILLALHVIVATENPQDVIALLSIQYLSSSISCIFDFGWLLVNSLHELHDKQSNHCPKKHASWLTLILVQIFFTSWLFLGREKGPKLNMAVKKTGVSLRDFQFNFAACLVIPKHWKYYEDTTVCAYVLSFFLRTTHIIRRRN